MYPALLSDFSKDDFSFCKESLSKVSRTFALNIKVLDGDLYKAVLLCYLLCRIIDTVEDCPDQTGTWKCELLEQFPFFLKQADDEKFKNWLNKALEGESKESEKELLAEAFRVLRGYWSLPPKYREHIFICVEEMSLGMSGFIRQFSQVSNVIIKDKEELERYCYFVAGTVGVFLTSSFCTYFHFSTKTKDLLMKNAVSFGLGLQLTNISKDIIEDRLRGWTYLPESFLKEDGLSFEDFMELKEENHEKIERVYLSLLDAAMEHLKNAFDYTLSLPLYAIKARIFCLWPLWMAVETLIVLKDQRKSLLNGKKVKITRQTVKFILAQTTAMSPLDTILQKEFSKKVKAFESL